MIKEVRLPEVSDNVENGDVLKVLVSVGDEIKVDQPVVELETEKATFEVPSSESGIVKQINVKQGDIIRIGEVILTVETNGEGEETAGTPVEKDDSAPVEKEDSTPVEEKAPEKAEVGKKSPEISKTESKPVDTDTEIQKEKTPEQIEPKPDAQVRSSKSPAPAAPSVRRLARELGVDINDVAGSGENGRISDDDVKAYVKMIMTSAPAAGRSAETKPLPDFGKWGEVTIEPMSKIRSITADSMTYAWTTIPMVTQFDKANISLIEEYRRSKSKSLEASGSKLTITTILVKLSELALKKFPQFNSSIDITKRQVIYKKYFNIGVAVDTDRGLIVPVLKNVDKKSLIDIAAELTQLSEKARSKKIMPDEMDGGNFTISNLGSIGGTGFTPIVYSPQTAILGVSRGSIEPVYMNGVLSSALMLPLALTYDHRIIDGADAARFLRWMCEALENPLPLLL